MKRSPTQTEHIKKLEWAIWLSQANFEGFTEGDWLKLKEGLYDFIYWKELSETLFTENDRKEPEILSSLPLKKEEFFQTVTHEQLREIQNYVRTMLVRKAKSGGRGFYSVFGRETNFAFGTYEASQPFVWMVLPGDHRVAGQFALGMHLVGSGITGEQIRSCPQCQRLFLLKRKPRKDRTFYCSSKCAVNTATKRYREKLKKEKAEEIKLKDRRRSRRRYETKIRAKPGHSKSKIAKKPRKARRA